MGGLWGLCEHLKQHGDLARPPVANTQTHTHAHTHIHTLAPSSMQHTPRILPPLLSARHLPPPPASRLYPCVSHTLPSLPISSAAPARITAAYPFTIFTPPTCLLAPLPSLCSVTHTHSTFTHHPPRSPPSIIPLRLIAK